MKNQDWGLSEKRTGKGDNYIFGRGCCTRPLFPTSDDSVREIANRIREALGGMMSN